MKLNTDYTKLANLSEWISVRLLDAAKENLSWQATGKELHRVTGRMMRKSELLYHYQALVSTGKMQDSAMVRRWLRSKPIRTLSGVAPVTVLTKPFPCPGECIFCPNDVRMPKSYLADEPGAQRAERNWFDPYLQTYSRLEALASIGHVVDKVEIIVLGGTWSYYPESYQIWFISECFQALNDWSENTDGRQTRITAYQNLLSRLTAAGGTPLSENPISNELQVAQHVIKGSDVRRGSYNHQVSTMYVGPEKRVGLDLLQSKNWSDLEEAQQKNETAKARCVGLSLETRPDAISQEEVIKLRRLGCTKTQIGIQSTQDRVLTLNKRGHDVAATRRAFALLRQAGYKIHAHWMANLYGSSPSKDIADFKRLFSDQGLRPDELKIYPCSLIGSAELMKYYQDGRWHPYTELELLHVVSAAMLNTPPYCRLTRVIRDIPSQYIVEGNKKTNFRQMVEDELKTKELQSRDIRAREIRSQARDSTQLKLITRRYTTSVSTEYFFEWNQKDEKQPDGLILGFLRLSLPKIPCYISELDNAAIIREIHVYGELMPLGDQQVKTQHGGLGKQLLEKAKAVASKMGYKKLTVISAVGTREYYRARGFVDGELYQHLSW
ncbi:tRNA uridine(34) 5-carboxymethylaminomethyl modification radical SAM/GNAT enzyme Elp3 [Candidatus Woesebacteria bacterium]|nr:tRNA uridine(34) 5-carboxymethylaminomethyl modification radical SAM/GNAT enzyme Elp3 [Candidatus Woesebacteria bacterium]